MKASGMKHIARKLAAAVLAAALAVTFMPLTGGTAKAADMDVHFDSETGILSWTEVEGAEMYGVMMEALHGGNTTYEDLIGDTHFDLYGRLDELATHGFMPDGGDYKITVSAYADEDGEEVIASWEDNLTGHTPTPVPIMDVGLTGSTLTWAEVEGAASYQALVEGNGGDVSGTSLDVNEYIDELLLQGSLQDDREDWEVRLEASDSAGKLIAYWTGMVHYKKVYPAAAKLAYTSVVYNGKAKKPAVEVVANMNGARVKLTEGTDYRLQYSAASPVNAGNYSVTVIGLNSKYDCGVVLTYTITKAASPLAAKGKTVTLKKAKVKKKNQTIKLAKAMKVTGKQGTVTYKKLSVSKKKYAKKFVVNKKTGKITVKKGLKKGTYKVKIKVSHTATKNYKAGSKTATVTVKVK